MSTLPTNLPPPPIRLCDLTIGYERRPAVHHLSGAFAPGSLTAVVGPNGGGKSTLLKGLAGALQPLSGTIDRGGLARADIAYLPQLTEIDRSFPILAGDLVAAGLWRTIGAFRKIGPEERSKVAGAMAAVGLTGFEDRAMRTLSGGQMQRALFARLVLQDCPVVLLDEPFASIDEATARDLLELLLLWNRQGRTVVAVIHDFDMVRARFPQTLLLAREPIGWGPSREILSAGNISRAQAMVAAFDPHAQLCPRSVA